MTSQRLEKETCELYKDVLRAFVCGVESTAEDSSSYRLSLVPEGYISVPSRKCLPVPTAEKPLSDKIFAVKDIYDIKGVITGAGSKAFIDLRAPASETAPCIQRLLDQGAVLVGKLKTVQFASGMAASDWVDFECPINPRGDGMLDPDCSSSGSAAAVAGYEWLDFSVGSDSLGSMIGPAAACGVFGLRPTHGKLSNVGAISVSSVLDTPGPFGRSISDLITVTEAWYLSSKDEAFDSPRRIIVPEGVFLPYSSEKRKLMQETLQTLTRQIAPMTEINLNSLWTREMANKVSLPAFKPFEEQFATTLAHIQLYDSYHHSAQFRDEYQTKHGKPPVVDPLIQFKRDLGSRISKEQYQAAVHERAAFKHFLEKYVFTPGTIMVLPGGMDTDVCFRDQSVGNSVEKNGMAWQGFGLLNTTYSALGGFPCVSVPVGQRQYIGKSGEPAFQPVSLWIIGPAGSDVLLMAQIRKCLQKGYVLPGKNLY